MKRSSKIVTKKNNVGIIDIMGTDGELHADDLREEVGLMKYIL